MRRSFRSFILVAAVAAASGNRVGAQEPLRAGTLSIGVRDSLGRSVAGAELIVEGTTARGITDDRGELRFSAVRGGPATIRVRRLGFLPASMDIMVDPRLPATVSVTLRPIPQRLAPIVVKGANYSSRMAGFYQRRDHGFGHFISRERIERDKPVHLTDVFRRIPGVRVRSTRYARNVVRLRGGSCAPLVWLDGTALALAEFDLDALPPESIEGIEVYSGVSQVPADFMGSHGRGACGVIVIWSREPARAPERRKNALAASELADLVAALQVYTADQVDSQARLASVSPSPPAYPEELYFTGVAGNVLAEFVVDTLGRIEAETVGIVWSTDARFSAAVQRVVLQWEYTPATLKGKRVRQLVQQPFSFEVDSSSVRKAARP